MSLTPDEMHLFAVLTSKMNDLMQFRLLHYIIQNSSMH